MEILAQPLCETPLFVTQKGCRSEFQTPPIKSFTSKIDHLPIVLYSYMKIHNLFEKSLFNICETHTKQIQLKSSPLLDYIKK
jgi:hypothetical protein